MKWLKEHKLLTIVGGIVIGLCLVILISFTTATGSNPFSKGISNISIAIQKPVGFISGGFRSLASDVVNFRKNTAENKSLKEKVALLESQNAKLKLKADELKTLQNLYKVFNYEGLKNRKALGARIIQMDLSNPYIVFTIDRGSADGVRDGSVVVDGDGVVGRVFEVDKKWAKVVSVLSENNNISFKTLRDSAVTGVLKGNGKNQLAGYLMDPNARIIKGDTLVTSGVGTYPEGIVIGKVNSVDFDNNKQLKILTVNPTVRFHSLQKVAVFI